MCWICGGHGWCLRCEGTILEATTDAERLFMRFAEGEFALLPVADAPPDETPERRFTVIEGGKGMPRKNE